MQVHANNITIELEDHGEKDDPAILLIMGYSAQLVYWPPAFIAALVARGYRVVSFDNRDVGLSYKFDKVRPPSALRQVLVKKLLPGRSQAPYNLGDMARDAVGVLDALEIDAAHIVGVSMGGMIGQIVAADHAHRALSFTAVMSSTNAPGLPGPSARVRASLMQTARVKATTREEQLDLMLGFGSMIASEENKTRTEERRELLGQALDRSFYPAGPKRQMAAIIETGNLRPTARRITAPTLVVHGADDPLIPAECGRDIAAAVPGARFELIEGMGHDFPQSKLDPLAALVANHCEAATEKQAGAAAAKAAA